MQPTDTATALDVSSSKKRTPVILKTKTILPKPKALSFKGKDAVKFFEWWKSFSVEQAGRADVKIYRRYPVINLRLANPTAKYENRIDTIDGEIPFEPDDYESHFLHNYGSGKYDLICNEKGVPGKVSGCAFQLEDPAYPPRVDYASLVQGHPENAGYILGLKTRGVKLPWESDQQEGKEIEDMTVAGQLAQTVMDTNERLALKNEQLVDKVVELRETAASPSTNATNESIKLVAETARQTQGMTIDALRSIVQSSAPTFNPLEMFKTFKELMPSGDNGIAVATMMLDMMKQNQQMQTDNLNRLMDVMKSQVQSPQPQANGIDQILEQADKLNRLKEVFGWNARPVSNPEPSSKGLVQSLLENPKVVESIGILSQVALALLTKMSGTPVLPNPAPQAQPSNLPTVAQPEKSQTPTMEEQQTVAFLKAIERPFLIHYFGEPQGLSGYSFARAMQCDILDATTEQLPQLLQTTGVSASGRSAYLTIRDTWGAQKLDILIRSYAPIWSTVQGNQKKYFQFVQEFFSYDEWEKKQAIQPNGVEKPN